MNMPSLTHSKAHQLAHAWLDSQNRRDLEEVLGHYAENIDFSSPFVANPKVAGHPSGRFQDRRQARIEV